MLDPFKLAISNAWQAAEIWKIPRVLEQNLNCFNAYLI